MIQQQASSRYPLSDDARRKLAARILEAPALDSLLRELEQWDTEFALQTLLDLHNRAELLAPHLRLTPYQVVVPSLPIALFGMVVFGFENWATWLVVGGIVLAFQLAVHRATSSQSSSLRERVRGLLSSLLPETTPSCLPTVLEVAATLGNPESNPTLLHTLIRLLPYFNSECARRTTPAQHRYLLRLLHTSHHELLVPTLLALGTLGKPTDSSHIRSVVPNYTGRVREAREECLRQLEPRRRS